jgi:Flavodoxin domain
LDERQRQSKRRKVNSMKAIVVYESLWGNTAAIARAIAEGIGPDAQAHSTAEATAAEIASADLIVAGAPVHAFSLPTESSRRNAGGNAGKTPPPDLSHPSMRSWLSAVPAGQARFAAFETAFRWSPSGATGAIGRGLQRAGYHPVAKAHRFIVTGGQGPLRPGEVEKARAWGAELAKAMGSPS